MASVTLAADPIHVFQQFFHRVSQAPTHPSQRPVEPPFDVAELYQGPADSGQSVTTGALPLDETLRQAYFWIVNHAIISPFYDIEYNDGPPQTYPIGDRREELVRVLLASIDVRPAGETIEQSFDRKATLDSVERSKVMQATIAAEKRARKIREAMARKAA